MTIDSAIIRCQLRDVDLARKVLEAWEACEIDEPLPDRLSVSRREHWRRAAFTADRDGYFVRWEWRDLDGPLDAEALEFIGHQLCALMSARGGEPEG